MLKGRRQAEEIREINEARCWRNDGSPVVDNGVDGDGDAVFGQDLLGRDVIGSGTEIDSGVRVDAGQDEKYSWSPGAALHQSSQTKDDGPLVLLHHLKRKDKSKVSALTCFSA